MDFLKPKEAKAKLDPRDGWLFKLKSKFTEDEMLFLEEEFDDLECIGMIRKIFYPVSASTVVEVYSQFNQKSPKSSFERTVRSSNRSNSSF